MPVCRPHRGSNGVGYTGKDSREGCNWYAPHFFDVGKTTTDINSINLNDGLPHGEGTVGWGDVMQIVGPGGNSETVYFYWDKSMDMSGTVTTDFFWADDTGFPVAVSFDGGDGICIDNMNGLSFQITNAGEVNAEKVSFPAREGNNFTGNPFAAEIDINAVNLDDGLPHGEGTVGWGDVMQIVGPGGNSETVYFYWDKSMDMSGTVTTDFFWADDTGFPVDVKLAPGAGICIDNMNGLTFDITIDCPYSL